MPALYQFECSRCGYRACVTGGRIAGEWVEVQTIRCHECRALHDAVLRIKSNHLPPPRLASLAKLAERRQLSAGIAGATTPNRPPRFPKILDRLQGDIPAGGRWLRFSLACPLSARHRISEWRVPGKCPICATFLESGAFVYRVWQ